MPEVQQAVDLAKIGFHQLLSRGHEVQRTSLVRAGKSVLLCLSGVLVGYIFMFLLAFAMVAIEATMWAFGGVWLFTIPPVVLIGILIAWKTKKIAFSIGFITPGVAILTLLML